MALTIRCELRARAQCLELILGQDTPACRKLFYWTHGPCVEIIAAASGSGAALSGLTAGSARICKSRTNQMRIHKLSLVILFVSKLTAPVHAQELKEWQDPKVTGQNNEKP